MLHTKYQGSISRGFRHEEISFRKSIFSPCDLDMQHTKTI